MRNNGKTVLIVSTKVDDKEYEIKSIRKFKTLKSALQKLNVIKSMVNPISFEETGDSIIITMQGIRDKRFYKQVLVKEG